MATKRSNDKEVYRLWWEYLKRSDVYRKLWDIIKTTKGKRDWNGKWWMRVTDAYEKKYIFTSKERILLGDDWLALSWYGELFGDVCEADFEEWWASKASDMLKKSRKARLPVLNLRSDGWMGKVIHYEELITGNSEFRVNYGGRPFKFRDLGQLMGSSLSYTYVGIPVVGETDMKTIAAQIKEIRDKYVKADIIKLADKVVRQAFVPTGSIRLDELKLYLDVYDLRQSGMKMPEVIKKLMPNHTGDPVNVSRQFFGYQKKAKKIILNVEGGYFPGEY